MNYVASVLSVLKSRIKKESSVLFQLVDLQLIRPVGPNRPFPSNSDDKITVKRTQIIRLLVTVRSFILLLYDQQSLINYFFG